MPDVHNNYDHNKIDPQSVGSDHAKSTRPNDKLQSQGHNASATGSPRNQDRIQQQHQIGVPNPIGIVLSPLTGTTVGMSPYQYSSNISTMGQQGGIPEFVPRGAVGMHYEGPGPGAAQTQGQGQGQGQGHGGSAQQQGQQGYQQQPVHYQPYFNAAQNQVQGYVQQGHHAFHPQMTGGMISGVRQVPTQQVHPHYQPQHQGQGHEMNMMHPQQQQQQLQQQLQQQQQQPHHIGRNPRGDDRAENFNTYNNNNNNNNNNNIIPRNMPTYPNGAVYRSTVSATISDYPYDAPYGASTVGNQQVRKKKKKFYKIFRRKIYKRERIKLYLLANKKSSRLIICNQLHV